MTIRPIEAGEAQQFHQFRLRALRECPEAFGSAYGEEEGFAADQIEARYASREGSLTLGAFDEHGQLVGMVGLHRTNRIKRRHCASVAGMFVAPEARCQGVGRALLAELISRAKRMDGLERLDLGVVTTCAAAMRLYEGHGFASYGIERRAHREGEAYLDMAHMILML